RTRRCVAIVDAVIGKPRASRAKIIMTLFQRVEKVMKGRNGEIRSSFQSRHKRVEDLRLVYTQSFVGTKRRIHTKGTLCGVHRLVVSEIVAWIVGGAGHSHIELFQDALRAEFGRL